MTIRYMNANNGGSESSPYETMGTAATTINQIMTVPPAAGDVILVRSGTPYSFGASQNIDVSQLTFCGYQTVKDLTDYWNNDLSINGSQFQTAWAEFANNLAGPTITLDNGVDDTRFLNIKFSGCTTNELNVDTDTSVVGSEEKDSLLFHNCWFEGGKCAMRQVRPLNFMFCKFTGTWSSAGADLINGPITNITGGLVYNCYFQVAIAGGLLVTNEPQTAERGEASVVVCNNIFTLDPTGTLKQGCVRFSHGGLLFNNIFYEPAGAEMDTDADDDGIVRIKSSSTPQFFGMWNNIFLSEAAAPVRAVVIDSAANTWKGYSDNNCIFGTDTDINYTDGPNDIRSNPKFVNAAGYDFRLRPTSPCLNIGQRVISGAGAGNLGATSMGAWNSWASPLANRLRARHSGVSIYK